MANLHSEHGKSVCTGNQPSEIRDTIDYERIKCYVRMFDPDFLAVQEVDGEKALKWVVVTDIYNVRVSSWSKPSGLNGKQNTGFSYKKGLTVRVMPENSVENKSTLTFVVSHIDNM